MGTKPKKFYVERMIWREELRWVYKVFCEEHKEGQGCCETQRSKGWGGVCCEGKGKIFR